MIPDGGFTPVENTPFDFRKAKTVRSGDELLPQNEDLQKGAGFDHCFVFEKGRDTALPIAELCGEKSGIRMLCYTTLPSVQLYAGNFLDMDGKGGYYGRCHGLCLETQDIPDNVNQQSYAEYGNSIYSAGEKYESETIYEFCIGNVLTF